MPKNLKGIKTLHLDVVDGKFAKNKTFQFPFKLSKQFNYRAHLMIKNPDQYVDQFAKAGSDLITFHVEACSDISSLIQKIKKLGCKAGISVNPETSIDKIKDFVGEVDLVLVMSVHPGFAGQKFIKDALPKISKAKAMIDKTDRKTYLQVDGGITNENAHQVKKHGKV